MGLIGMIGQMAVDNCETVWTIVAVEVLASDLFSFGDSLSDILPRFLGRLSVLKSSDSTCGLSASK